MSLTRKMLTAMDIPADKIDEIISAHTETVNAIKESNADELKKITDERNALQTQVAELERVEEDFNNFKVEVEKEKATNAKVKAYAELLKEIGISEKRIPAISKLANMEEIEIDGDGKIKNADNLKTSLKTEWADFIVAPKKETGVQIANPALNVGNNSEPKPKSRAAELAKKYHENMYGSNEAPSNDKKGD